MNKNNKQTKPIHQEQYDYITKEECERRGIIRGKDGIYRKLTTLEKYFSKGWLDFGSKNILSAWRIAAGIRFHDDFDASFFNCTPAIDLEKIKVDGGKSQNLPDSALDARFRVRAAVEAIGKPYNTLVYCVCGEDKPISIKRISVAQYRHDLELAKEYLCLGLDKLVNHYGLAMKQRKSKITGYSENNTLEEWLKEIA